MTARGGLRLGVRTLALPCALRMLLCAAVATLAAGAVAAEDAGLVPAFGSLPQVRDVVLSPGGSLLAWQDAAGSDPQVVIFDIVAHKNVRTVRIPTQARLRSLQWGDDATLLISVSFTAATFDMASNHRYENFRTLACDVASGQTRSLLTESGFRLYRPEADLIAWHTAKPHTVVMGDWAVFPSEFGWQYSLFDVDIHSAKVAPLASAGGNTFLWVLNTDGLPVARDEWRPNEQIFSLYAKEGSGWREIVHREHHEVMSLFGISPDGKSVLMSGEGDDGRTRLWRVPLDGSPPTEPFPDAREDVEEVLPDPRSGAPVAVRFGGLQQTIRWLDADAERRQQSLARVFPGRDVRVVGRSESSSRVVVETQGPAAPPIYYLVDFTTHKADIVGEAYPALAKVPLGKVEEITYKARDGTMIPAYFTRPPGGPDHGLAIVVLPHSGPEERDNREFDWLVQFLAARGYGVLQPEFRGSTGFGGAFRRAGYRQWGGLMQDDVSDGVRFLTDQGIADPRRVCVVGRGRYGGYAALAGAALTPDLYACAASINGVADLAEMLRYMREHDGYFKPWLSEHIGTTPDPQLLERSPAHIAARVHAPVLLIHAAQDTIVPPSQSEFMAEALKKAGGRVTLVALPDEDHDLSSGRTRVQVLTELDRFLGASLH